MIVLNNSASQQPPSTSVMAEHLMARLTALNRIIPKTPDKAIGELEQLLRDAHLIHSPLLEARIHSAIGYARFRLKELDPAMHNLLQALAVFESLHERNGIAECEIHIGSIYALNGNFPEACPPLERGLAIAQANADLHLQVQALNYLGITYGDMGNLTQAIAILEHAQGLVAKIDDAMLTMSIQINLAQYYLRSAENDNGNHQRLRQALQLCHVAMASARNQRYTHGLLAILDTLALVHFGLGDIEHALSLLQEQESLAQYHNASYTLAYNALARGRIYLHNKNYDTAVQALNAGIDYATPIGANNALELLHLALSRTYEENRDFAAALEHHKRFYVLRNTNVLQQAERHARLLAVRLGTERAQLEATREHLRAEKLALQVDELAARAEDLSRDSLQDGLTGLANRRRLDAELMRRLNGSALLAVAMIDLDHFKLINDTYSHAIGDETLKRVAQILSRNCRNSDLAARFGGEEFMMIFDKIDANVAHAICERIRRSVEQYDWDSLHLGLQVTISIGIVDNTSQNNLKEIVAAVDAQLYRAKRSGRNRTCKAEYAGN